MDILRASEYNIGDKVYYIQECEVSGLNKNVGRGEDFDITIKFRNGGERETVSEKIIPVDMFQRLINNKLKFNISNPSDFILEQTRSKKRKKKRHTKRK